MAELLYPLTCTAASFNSQLVAFNVSVFLQPGFVNDRFSFWLLKFQNSVYLFVVCVCIGSNWNSHPRMKNWQLLDNEHSAQKASKLYTKEWGLTCDQAWLFQKLTLAGDPRAALCARIGSAPWAPPLLWFHCAINLKCLLQPYFFYYVKVGCLFELMHAAVALSKVLLW